jgi:hypothetical protein
MLDKILDYTLVAAETLRDVAVATGIPFIDSVSTLSLKFITTVQVR